MALMTKWYDSMMYRIIDMASKTR